MVGRSSVDAARRHLAMRTDQIAAIARHRLAPPRRVPLGTDPRLALVTVNFSTTRYLKLMLLTLGEQDRLDVLARVVVVDHASRDGGPTFLARLSQEVPRLHLVTRRHFLHHATGMRAGVRALDRVDGSDPAAANLLLFCDPDVVFRSPHTLGLVADAAVGARAAVLGEPRPRTGAIPSIQASFYVVARGVYARRDVCPPVHHGSPTYWQQLSVRRAGLPVVDFPSNHGGHILHRGRAGVAAAARYRPHHPYATVRAGAHFMGVRGGAEAWAEIEGRYGPLLSEGNENELLEVLADRLARLGGQEDVDREHRPQDS